MLISVIANNVIQMRSNVFNLWIFKEEEIILVDIFSKLITLIVKYLFVEEYLFILIISLIKYVNLFISI